MPSRLSKPVFALRAISILAVTAAVACASAQESTPPPAPAATCAAAEHHQFDFWLGEWNVSPSRAPDRIIARSTIRSSAAGCVIDETWQPLRGDEGRSLSAYNPQDQRWHQFYIDASGAQTQLVGALNGDAMVWEFTKPDGGRGRMSLRALDANTVRQWGEDFDPAQNTWTPSFDLTYRRVSTAG